MIENERLEHQPLSNKFEVLTSRGKGSRREVKKDRKMVLKEEKLKKGKKKRDE